MCAQGLVSSQRPPAEWDLTPLWLGLEWSLGAGEAEGLGHTGCKIMASSPRRC